MKESTIIFRVDKETKKALEKEAKKKGIKLSELLRHLITNR